MIDFQRVRYSYPGADSQAIAGVSLCLSPGEIVVLVGANGSGKSTLARMCNGLLIPDEGSVTVDGMDTSDGKVAFDIRARVGLVLQNPDNQIVGTVVEEDVAFGPENLGVPCAELRVRVDEALAAVGLSGLERREPHLLSEGQKQRLAIAGALAMQPRYMVFDESTAMLDPQGRRDVLAVMRKLRVAGHGILHVTHHLDDAADADRVIALASGAIAFDGTPEELFSDEGLLVSIGLELPPLASVATALRRSGLDVPVAVANAQSLVEALWP
ncbi:MAG: energy-coupling factor transporter ATPase [Coriobacteriia bacterium]|nr:energy-coupling factor transporter ATPase [Coriobacteriia bacterium]MBN2823279.1 energy-coupling factor transporter ATPase [Coriobacteriia bacterium]